MPLSELALRDVAESDREILYEQQREPEGCAMAAFPARDRAAYLEHLSKVLADRTAVLKTVVCGGRVAGSVGTFLRFGKREVCYWLGKEFWGRGVAPRALAEFLTVIQERPLYARVAKSNPRSRRVVEKCGFKVVGEDTFPGPGGKAVEELLLRLD